MNVKKTFIKVNLEEKPTLRPVLHSKKHPVPYLYMEEE